MLRLLSVALLFSLGAACQVPGDAERAASDADGLTFVDALDREVHLAEPARRLVSLAPNLTEIAFAAGAGDSLLAVTRADDFPPPVAEITRISALPLDVELLVEIDPDLVLATTQVNSTKATDMLEALEIPVAFFSFRSIEDVFEATQAVGRLTGHLDAARDTVQALRASLEAATITETPGTDRPRVLFLIGRETLYSFGNESYVHEMIRRAGGYSITQEIGRAAPVLSEEYVLEQDPDLIIGAWGADASLDALLAAHPSWRTLRAVRAGHVYGVDPDLVLRPGPRLVEGVRELKRRIEQATP